jgi:carbonic anhydrase/acetyltransferase-like protein (isoleucine patch superfamily)
MQPRLHRQPLQLGRQVARFHAVQLRVPQAVGAAGKARVGVAQRFEGEPVVLADFVGRVDQHQRAARRRRQLGAQAGKTVRLLDLHRAAGFGERGVQQLVVGGVQFEQTHAVVFPQQRTRDHRRAGVGAQLFTAVEGAHQIDVGGQLRRQVGRRPELCDAARVLGILLRVAAVQRIAARTGVRVDVPVGFVLLVQVLEQFDQYEVLEDIGRVAGVKGVTVAEHGSPRVPAVFSERPPERLAVLAKPLFPLWKAPLQKGTFPLHSTVTLILWRAVCPAIRRHGRNPTKTGKNMPIYRLGEHTPQMQEGVWIADTATVIGDVHLGRNVNLWFGAILRGDNDPITIGDNTNVQDAAVLHTDDGVPLDIGANVTVGHKAMLHGCKVGEGSLIGINAVVLNRAVIGKHCLIGANSLIPEGKVIPDRSLVCGSPGRIIRELTDHEISKLQASADSYVNNALRYQEQLVEL